MKGQAMPFWAVMTLALAGYALLLACIICGYILYDNKRQKKRAERFNAELAAWDEQQWQEIFKE